MKGHNDMVTAQATLFTLRLSRQVNPEIFQAAGVINTWETGRAQFPGINAPAHLSDLYEVNVWVNRPNTLRGAIMDHNNQWPGLKVGIVSVKHMGSRLRVSPSQPEPCETCGRLLCDEVMK